MSRLSIPVRESVPVDSKPLLDAVEKQIGMIPNLFRLVSLSPHVLRGWLGLNDALGKTLDVGTRESIALAVAEINGCEYCLPAHTYVGLNPAKIDAAEIAMNRRGTSSQAKKGAAVAFAAKLTREHGRVSDADLWGVKTAGYSEAQIVEIIAVVVGNIFTNYVNNVAHTEIDFPVAVEAA